MKRLLAVLFAAFIAVPALAQAPAKPDIIEVIEINGEISQHTAAGIAAAVEKINETPKIKAVILAVNSPGGGASASAVIYQELSKIKVPVVGYCQYLCASGGAYALMAPSVKFVAVRDDSIGGSIGVIMTATRFHRLLDWAKIDNDTFKSGALKDSGNPTREMNAADRVYFQKIIDQLAEKFYDVVVKARKPNPAQLAEIKTASIFIGQDNVRVGLADAVMTWDEVVAKAKELSKSKSAFTRDELRKLTKDASEAASMRPIIPTASDGWLGHADKVMELLSEIRAGESVKFAYRMPYQF